MIGPGVLTAWRAAIVAAYVARPLSCAAVLALEPRDPDNRYASVDPHGFGVLGAVIVAAVFALPVLWLTLQRRPAGGPVRASSLRSGTVLLVLGSPMMLQLTYVSAPIGWSWPIWAASAVWLLAVASVCFDRGAGGPSIDAAFARHPVAAWSIVALTAAAKLAVVPLAFPNWPELLG